MINLTSDDYGRGVIVRNVVLEDGEAPVTVYGTLRAFEPGKVWVREQFDADAKPYDPEQCEWPHRLEIEFIPDDAAGGAFRVREGDKSIDGLNFGEMIDVVIARTHRRLWLHEAPYGGMRTEDQYIAEMRAKEARRAARAAPA